MANRWAEVVRKRIRTGKHYEELGSNKRLFQSVIRTPLHYASNPDSTDWANNVDMRGTQVDISDLDGFQYQDSDFHFHAGHIKSKSDNGWFSVSGRQGQASIGMRLHRAGITDWLTKDFSNIVSNPIYNSENIVRNNGILTLGPAGFQDDIYGSNIIEWSNVWDGVTLRWVLDGRKVKTEVVFSPTARAALIPSGSSTTDYFSLIFQLDTSGLLGKSGISKFRQDGVEKHLADGFDDENDQVIRSEDGNDNLLGIMPLDKAYSDKYVWTEDEYLEQDETRLTKRLYERDGKTYLMVGASLADLNSMHAGSITFDPTFEDQPDATDGVDNFLDGASTTKNRGTNVRMRTDADDKRAVIEFDASSIDEDATCDSATLSLWSEDSLATKAYDIYSLDSAVATWTETGSTYVNYKASTAWPGSAGASTSGTDYEATSLGAMNYPESSADTEDAASLTAARVEGWFGVTNTNYGLLIGVTGATSGRDWHSSDAVTAGFRPQISITYTEAGGVSVTPAASTIDLLAIDPTVSLGSVSITPAASTIDLLAIDPTVSLGSVSITPSASTIDLLAIDPAVSFGSVSITPSASTIDLLAIDPAVSLGSVSITPTASTIDLLAIDPAVSFGSVSITPSASTIDLLAIDPTVSLGSVSITPSASTIDLLTIDPTVTGDGIEVTPAASTIDLLAIDPTVSLGSVSITPSASTIDLLAIDPAVSFGSVSITPTASTIDLLAIDPAVSFGSVSITPTASTINLLAIDPTVLGILPSGIVYAIITASQPSATITASQPSVTLTGKTE